MSCKKPTLSIHSEKLVLNQDIYKKGVAVITIKLQRIMPEVKTIGLAHMIQAYRSMNLKKEIEAIIVDEKDFVREGASTNVFVIKAGTIYTPANKILTGTTRNRVIDLAKQEGIKISIQDFKIEKLRHADEIFLTNRPKEIIPVTKLDGKTVGNGKIGPITQRMILAYKKYVKNYIQVCNQ